MNKSAIFGGLLDPANGVASTTVFNTTLETLLSSTGAGVPESGPGVANSKLIEIIVYMIIWLFGTIGTLLVAYVVLTSRKFKSSTNTHLLNLALADLIYLQGIPFIVLYVIKQEWIFSELVCKLYFILSLVNQYTGIFILTMLSFDRFLAVCKPNLVEFRKTAASKPCVAVVWVSGIFFMLPIIIYSNTETMKLDHDPINQVVTYETGTTTAFDLNYEYSNRSLDVYYNEILFPIASKDEDASSIIGSGLSTPTSLTTAVSIDYFNSHNNFSRPNAKQPRYAKICTVMWPTMKNIKLELAFIVFGCIVSFLIPIVTISYFYIRIIIRLKSSSFKFSKTESHFQQMKRKRINLMVLFIIGVSIVCYTPYWLFQMFLVNYYIFHPNGVPSPIFGQLATFFQLLIYFNAALNPYLYAFFSEIFLARFREAFICCSVVKRINGTTNGRSMHGLVSQQPNNDAFRSEAFSMRTRYRESVQVEEKSLLPTKNQLKKVVETTLRPDANPSLSYNHSQTNLI